MSELVSGSAGRDDAALPTLAPAHWLASAYPREQLPERVLQFGTGMLLRALPAALIDAANAAGARAGRIVVVQSTPRGVAGALDAQGGLYTLVERGVENGRPVDRARLVGAVSRALVAAHEWAAVRRVAASPDLRAVVSNVTEAGFRLGDDEPVPSAAGDAPPSFPGKLAALLRARHDALGANAPPLLVIPTELVDENGPALAAMVDAVAARYPGADRFRAWIAARVHFCSSLVGRITTGTPAGDARAALDVRLGYRDALATVAEPYALWAVEGDPALLREALPIDAASGAAVFAPSIAFYRERKVRLLNGAHTALAPLAVLAGVPTVREAAEHPVFGPYLARVLFGEIVPATSIPAEEAEAFARTVVDRFRNPHLRHEWRTIATNQTAKVRLRVVPSVVRHAAAGRGAPPALVLALAGYLRYLRPAPDARAAGRGRWRGATYEVDDADAGLVARHWLAAERGARAETVEEGTLRLVADLAVRDAALWGAPLGDVLGLPAALAEWLVVLERDGVEGALRRATEAGAPGEPRERPAAAVGAG